MLGGTSLSVFMGAIGILCNVGKSKEICEEFKKYGFIIRDMCIQFYIKLYTFFYLCGTMNTRGENYELFY